MLQPILLSYKAISIEHFIYLHRVLLTMGNVAGVNLVGSPHVYVKALAHSMISFGNRDFREITKIQ